MEVGPCPPLRALCAAVALALFLAVPAAAISASVETRRLLHDTWLDTNGATFGAVHGLAQGADGYLWISSDAGLLRFDGLRFSRPAVRAGKELPAGVVNSLLSQPDGSLWAATLETFVRLHDGQLDVHDDNAPGKSIRRFADAGGGAVWMLDAESLWRLAPGDRAARRFTAGDGLPNGTVEAIASAGPGALWLGVDGDVCRWRPGAPAECFPVPGAMCSLFSTGPDDVYVATSRVVAHISHGAVDVLTRDLTSVSVMFGALHVDRAGDVWVGTASGLLRLRQGAVERFTRRDGLTADTVEAVFEDSEGDLWVGTRAGLDRFRDPRVLHFTSLNGLSTDFASALLAAPDGAVWIGMIGALDRWEKGRISTYSVAQGLPGRAVSSLGIDTNGVLWVAGDHGIARFQDGRLVPGFADAQLLREVYSIAADTAGGVWFADQKRGAWRFFGGRASPVSEATQPDLFRLAGAPDGSMWFGLFNHGVARWRSGRVEPIDLQRTGGVGPARAVFASHDGSVWIGAGRTLSRIRDGKVTTWGPRQGLPPEDIQGIVEDAAGVLWVATVDSVLRVARPDAGAGPGGGPPLLHMTRYSGADGLHKRQSNGMYGPRIAVAGDGRVWVCELDGVAVLDPELLRPDAVPPPVHVEQIVADGAVLPWGVRAFRGRETRLEYTGISLRAPDRVHFKYRLDPGLPDWTDAENRRYVSLVNLEPAHYTFRVMACNLDEVCNEQGDAIEFQIIPYFHQTVWFKLLLVAFAAGLAWSFHLLRLRNVKTRFRLAAQERARVTREIHDTLLQGFAGVVYQLDAASRQFDSQPAASKERLNRALDQADNALTEARRTLQDMRLPVLEDSTLPEALQDVGVKAVEGAGAAFALRVKGNVAPLPYAAQAAMFLIGREAINNAATHSGAARITVHLHYTDREFRMLVQDDGSGFDPAEARKKVGHFGVESMAVRARQAGADFHIDTAPGKGAAITVTVKR